MPASSAIPRLPTDLWGERRSLFNWIAASKQAEIQSRTSTQDCSSEINTAIAEMSALGGGILYVVEGRYALAHPIIGASNVGLVCPASSPRYGTAGQKFATFYTLGTFPANGKVLDFSQCTNTYLEGIEVIGDGTGGPPQTNATTTGLYLGNLSGGTNYARHMMRNCSFTKHKYGVYNRTADYCWWEYNNFGDNWYCNVYFDQFGGNDGTYIGNYINTGNYDLVGGTDPLNDVFPGVGLYLGYGCADQSWIGGKIEYNGTGIVLKQAFGCHFDDIHFDSNSKWHIRMISGDASDDLATVTNLFAGCRFNGGAWPDFASSIGNYDGHVFIEGQRTGFYPAQISTVFSECSFKAAAKTSIYGENPNVSVKYPTTNIVASRVTGVGAGKPELSLQMIGCDARGGAQVAGTCDVAGFTVTRLTGPSFDSSWIGRTITIEYFNPYAITAVADASHLTISDTATLTNQPWSVDLNGVQVDSNFTASSQISLIGVRGVVPYNRQSVNERIPLQQVVDSAGNLRYQMDYDATTTLNAVLTAYGLTIHRDVNGVLYVGRYDSGFSGAVVDFASPDGVNNPTFASLRVASDEKVRLISTGLVAPNSLAAGQSVHDAGYKLSVAGASWLKSSTRIDQINAPFLNTDGDGFIGTKSSVDLNSSEVRNSLQLAHGGTGGTDASSARSNLDVYSKSEVYTKAEVDALIASLTAEISTLAGEVSGKADSGTYPVVGGGGGTVTI